MTIPFPLTPKQNTDEVCYRKSISENKGKQTSPEQRLLKPFIESLFEIINALSFANSIFLYNYVAIWYGLKRE